MRFLTFNEIAFERPYDIGFSSSRSRIKVYEDHYDMGEKIQITKLGLRGMNEKVT